MVSKVNYRPEYLVSNNGSITIQYLSSGYTNIQTAGGGGVPASPSTSVQFNNAGAFGGSANFTYNTGTNTVSFGNITGSALGMTIQPKAPVGAEIANFLELRGTNASATNGDGGGISLTGGVPLGTGTGGSLQFSAGNTNSGVGGSINFISGFGLSQGGSFGFSAGSGDNGDGGQFSMNAGSADGIGNGGRFEMLAGSNSFGSGVGGDFYLQTGGAGSNVSGNFQILIGGGGAGSGTIILGTDSNTDCFRITESSGVSQMGFFNATPVAKPAPTASGPFAVLNQVVAALNNLGLISSANLTYSASTPVTLTYAATITPASSSKITYRMTMTGNLVINAPSGAADGDQVEFWLTASGGARTVTFSFAHIPSSSTLTSPVTIASGTQGELMFRYDSVLGAWKAARFVNGYI